MLYNMSYLDERTGLKDQSENEKVNEIYMYYKRNLICTGSPVFVRR